jgi:hypothetical protein
MYSGSTGPPAEECGQAQCSLGHVAASPSVAPSLQGPGGPSQSEAEWE